MRLSPVALFAVSSLACTSVQAPSAGPSPTVTTACRIPPSWAEIHPGRASAIAAKIERISTACKDSTADEIATIARRWHTRAFGCRGWCGVGCESIVEPRLARAAARLYVASLSHLGGASDDKYWYANLLWAVADASKDRDASRRLWTAAAMAFEVAAAEHEHTKLRQDSSYAAILAWKHSFTPNLSEPARTHERCRALRPLTRPAKRFIAAMRKYSISFPDDDEELLWMWFWEANLHAQSCDHARALPILTRIVDAVPDREVGVLAAELGVISLLELGRGAEANRWKQAVDEIRKHRAGL